MSWRLLFSVAAACTSSACTSGSGAPGAAGPTPVQCDGGTATQAALFSESVNDACGSLSSSGKGEGEACSGYTDCKPVCCACGGPNKKTGLASACENGRCAAPEAVCCAYAASAGCKR